MIMSSEIKTALKNLEVELSNDYESYIVQNSKGPITGPYNEQYHLRTRGCIRRGINDDFINFFIDVYGLCNIAGGYVRWMLDDDDKNKPRDIDLWPRNKDSYDKLIKIIEEKYSDELSAETDISLNYISNGRAGIICKCIQIIKPNDSFGMHDAIALINRFDISICRACLYVYNGDIYFICYKTLKADLSEKRFRVLYITNPLSSMKRIEKYIRMGYRPTVRSYIRVLQYAATVKTEIDDMSKMAEQGKDYDFIDIKGSAPISFID